MNRMLPCFILAMALCLEGRGASSSQQASEPSFEIVITGQQSQGGKLKAPARIPISAVCYPSMGRIGIECLDDLGPLLIEIQGCTTGASTICAVSGAAGLHFLSVPTNPGGYILYVTLASGVRYAGTYQL